MYAQLGNTIFDGLKSFVSFTNDEEAILVEHALINRKPRLQASGLSLRTLTITLYLNQEFCVVATEIANLRKSKDSFEILPLLWGNGTLEGNFVIAQFNIVNRYQDSIGNLIAADINITLKESVIDNGLDQLQQQAQTNAFAVGDKVPATKSKRKNPSTCNKNVANYVRDIQAQASLINGYCLSFSSQFLNIARIEAGCKIIVADCNQLIAISNNPTSCINGTPGVNANATNIINCATTLQNDCSSTNSILVKSDNAALQASIQPLVTCLNSAIKASILNQ